MTETQQLPRPDPTRSKSDARALNAQLRTMSSVQMVDIGVSTIQGTRPYQEDRYKIIHPGELKHEDLAFFAVYDGHGGTDAVDRIEQNLHDRIDNLLYETEPEKAIQQALDAEDEALKQAGVKDGSTVAVVLYDTVSGSLAVANLGDSHVFLTERTKGIFKSWKTTRLSITQNLTTQAERARVIAAGGKLHFDTGVVRVGELCVSRALGDLEYKMPQIGALSQLGTSDPNVSGIPRGKIITQDLIINEAHTTTKQLQTRSMLMIATDGLGEARQAEDVAKAAAGLWQDGSSAQQVADELTRRASLGGSYVDNCTVIIVCLDQKTEPGRKASQSLAKSPSNSDRRHTVF